MQCRCKEERRSCEGDVLKAGFAFVFGIAEVNGLLVEGSFPVKIGVSREGAFLEVGGSREGASPEVGGSR